MLDLFFKVIEVEAFAFLQLFRHFSGGFFVYAFLDIFNQAQHVAHTEDATGDAVWVEGFESCDFFTDTDKFDGFSGNVAHRQCRAAA